MSAEGHKHAGNVEQWELVDALRDATKILEAEFADTEGAGRQALVKCRTILSRATYRAIEPSEIRSVARATPDQKP
jgi:hypothetical protein